MDGDRASRIETVTVGAVHLRVPMPEDWEQLDPPPHVWFVAREPTGDWFRANVTVAADHGGPLPSPEVAGAQLACQLPGGVLIDARRHGEGSDSVIVVVAHTAEVHDMVTVQRQLWLGDATLAVSYTCAVEQLPGWRERFDRWVDQVELDPPLGLDV
jgi:hypothetical protein